MEEKVKRKWYQQKKVIIALVLICIVGSNYFVRYISVGSNVDKAGKILIEQLDKKYNKKFKILNGEYLSQVKAYQFNVAEKDETNPDYSFRAWISSVTGKPGVSNNYPIVQRWITLKKWIKPYLDKITTNCWYTANPNIKRNDSKDTYGKALHDGQANNFSLQQMLDKHSRNMKAYIEVYYAYDITPKNKEHVLKAIYALIQFLREKNFEAIELHINFYKASVFKKETVNEVYKFRKKWKLGSFTGKYQKDETYSFWMYPHNVKKVKLYKDLDKKLYSKEKKDEIFRKMDKKLRAEFEKNRKNNKIGSK